MPEKLLSKVIFGRNDNYLKDYLYRLSIALNVLAENLSQLNKLEQVEVIFVDWGSTVPLREVLTLTPPAAQIVNFVELTPKQVAEASPGTKLHSTLAVNVGIRRARGEYIMLTDSDSMMPSPSLNALLNLLEGNHPTSIPLKQLYLHIRRYQIPWHLTQRQPSVKEWNRYLCLLGSSLKAEPFASSAACLGGFAAAQLLHRNLWHELGGYDESLDQPWGWCDNDLMLRLSQQYSWLDPSPFGIYSMHMEHWPKYQVKPASKSVNPMLINSTIEANNTQWGLADNQDITLKHAKSNGKAKESIDYLPLKGLDAIIDNFAELYTEDIEASVIAAIKNNNTYDYQKEAATLFGLYAMQCFPRNFYWFGTLDLDSFMPALYMAPAIECYFISPWNEGIISRKTRGNPADITYALKHVDYKGYAKIILGDTETALSRIKAAPFSSEGMEMVYISHSIDEDCLKKILPEIYAQLENGGIIVISKQTPGEPNRSYTDKWFKKNRKTKKHFPKKMNFRKMANDPYLETISKVAGKEEVYAFPKENTIIIAKLNGGHQ